MGLPPPSYGQTDECQNITFPHPSDVGGKYHTTNHLRENISKGEVTHRKLERVFLNRTLHVHVLLEKLPEKEGKPRLVSVTREFYLAYDSSVSNIS